ncbi:hypothetical protein, partial [Bradyrhizobium uaiense]|uniref:hypothetical protein n=1 Tax=Bradyrhizobium uaiense TaxID=2594946 RepID=UPI003D311C3E
ISGTIQVPAHRTIGHDVLKHFAVAIEKDLIPWQQAHEASPHARDDARLTFAEDDILAPNAAHLRGRFNAIRVSNLLNHGYF